MTERKDSMDRLIRNLLITFVGSIVVLAAIAAFAVKTDRLHIYMHFTGVIYLVLCTLFLWIIAKVFVQGHMGSSREIEAPKMEIFDLENDR